MKLQHHELLFTLEKRGVVGESAISVWVCNRGFWMYVWEDVCVIVQFPSLQSIVGQGEKKENKEKNLDPKPLQVAY